MRYTQLVVWITLPTGSMVNRDTYQSDPQIYPDSLKKTPAHREQNPGDIKLCWLVNGDANAQCWLIVFPI